MKQKLDPKDREFLKNATQLLNKRLYVQAEELLNARTAQGITTDRPEGLLLLSEIAGFLIDVGSEGRIEGAINKGVALIEHNRARLDGLVTPASIEYNLGNGKIALAELHDPNPFTTPGLADHDLLLAAKNHYWKALKLHDRDDNFANELQTNLAGALRKSGRISEALSTYDNVIAANPNFTMAHFHRGLALLVLERLSGSKTTTLLRQAAAEYSFTVDAADAMPGVRESAASMRDYVDKRLARRRKTTGAQADEQDRQIRQEAETHSPYRQFTLRHHLGLSEHSLYCHCRGARRDDLMIATNARPVTGDQIPRLELILNRLKAEFGAARLLFYKATQQSSWDLHDEEMTYAELLEGEAVSMASEFLRTSFRLCLGILDKITLGVCELYDIADNQENLHLESFWRPTARKGKASTRWDKLTARSKNPSLVALYSQATDLGSDGEWAIFKNWRNDLEHRFLILTDEPTPPDILKARQGTFHTRCVTIKEFRERALQLMQFTRSAIFNFAFCVRHETRATQEGPSVTLTLHHKEREDRISNN